MTSQGTNHVLNEHLDFSQQHWCDNIRDDIVIQLSCKFQESIYWTPDWVIALLNSFDTIIS